MRCRRGVLYELSFEECGIEFIGGQQEVDLIIDYLVLR